MRPTRSAGPEIFDQSHLVESLDGLSGGSMRAFDHTTCGQQDLAAIKKSGSRPGPTLNLSLLAERL